MISSRKPLSIPRALLFLGSLSTALVGCALAANEDGDEDTAGTTSEALSKKCGPEVPDPSLAVPDGNRLAFELDAVGVQIYACQATATGYSWVFQAPEADLYRHRHVVGTHYAGPTWELGDGSKVVAAKVAGFTTDPSAIPWLLLQANSHAGEGRMSEITYIQRLDTSDGLAPTAGCNADSVSTLSRIDYTATYFFYEASHGHGPHCR